MTALDTGGPAFPSHHDDEFGYSAKGMALRDYFAAHVDVPFEVAALTIAAALNMHRDEVTVEQVLECRAAMKIEEADAMLAARNGKGAA